MTILCSKYYSGNQIKGEVRNAYSTLGKIRNIENGPLGRITC
jgi:hypothetical protein